MIPLRLTGPDVAAFVAASGNTNPMHVDPSFARTTAHGAPTVPAALGALAALAVVDPETLRSSASLSARYVRPLFTGRTYRVVRTDRSDGGCSVVVREGGAAVLGLDLAPGDGLDTGPVPAVPPDADPGADPARPVAPGDRITTDRYAIPDPTALATLAERLGAGHVPAALRGVLAWSSWFTGTRVPGRDGLDGALSVSRAEARTAGVDATVATADERTGAVVVDATCGDGTLGYAVRMRAFRRLAVPGPTRASATEYLEAGDALDGRRVLAVGGSRGIGAALAATLATQGATVWAAQRTPGRVEALARDVDPDRIRPVTLDALDKESVRAAATRLGDEAGRLDGLVLSAGPAVLPAPLDPDTVDTVRAFVDTSLALALRPLAAVRPLLAPGAWIVLLSSGAVEDVPDQHPHYVAAKSAIEALGRYCATRHGHPVLLVRAPKMWTDLTNGPLGARGTVPAGRVAATVVDRIRSLPAAAPDAPAPVVVLGPDELVSAPDRSTPAR